MADPQSPTPDALLRTPLDAWHQARGAKMVPFAGYSMPVQYPLGVLKEHVWTRTSAGLFDVSHMGQGAISGPDHSTVAAALEALMPADILALAPGRIRYSQLTNGEGGILDDLMVTRPLGADGTLGLVVNASRKAADWAHIRAHLPAGVTLQQFADRALLALQGPMAAAVLTQHCPEAAGLAFMTAADLSIGGLPCGVARSGYTGEDGFEISVPAARAVELADLLTADARVQPIGLGARDSLRLEAGLCLYGHDIDETTTPVEAGLTWSIQKRRREAGGFPGAARVLADLANGPARVRVGIKPDGRAPAREGAEVRDASGQRIGVITSGGFGPTADGPVAMGYVAAGHAAAGTSVHLSVRDKVLPATVVALPFVPHRYVRK